MHCKQRLSEISLCTGFAVRIKSAETRKSCVEQTCPCGCQTVLTIYLVFYIGIKNDLRARNFTEKYSAFAEYFFTFISYIIFCPPVASAVPKAFKSL